MALESILLHSHVSSNQILDVRFHETKSGNKITPLCPLHTLFPFHVFCEDYHSFTT